MQVPRSTSELVDRYSPSMKTSRRTFLQKATAATVGLLLSVPLLGGLSATLLRPSFERRWVEAGRVDDLRFLDPRPFRVLLAIGPVGDPEIEREVYAVRKLDGSLIVFLNECTHLGCPVRWLEGRQLFYCPCHRGYFNVVGYDVNGPPPRPLIRLRHRVEDGILFVSNEKVLTEESEI